VLDLLAPDEQQAALLVFRKMREASNRLSEQA
jgi:hypothetical protein